METVSVRQLLQQAERLRELVLVGSPNESKVEIRWDKRSELQSICEEILLSDLRYALSNNVDQLMWNFCYKNVLDSLQKNIQFGSKISSSKKIGNSNENEVAWLSMFLNASLANFSQLLIKLSMKYPSKHLYGVLGPKELGILYDEDANVLSDIRDGLVDSIVQFCLIHMGNIFCLILVHFSPQLEHFFNTNRGGRLTKIDKT